MQPGVVSSQVNAHKREQVYYNEPKLWLLKYCIPDLLIFSLMISKSIANVAPHCLKAICVCCVCVCGRGCMGVCMVCVCLCVVCVHVCVWYVNCVCCVRMCVWYAGICVCCVRMCVWCAGICVCCVCVCCVCV